MKLPYANFQQAEYVRHIWLATPELGTTPEDIVKPEYWTHLLKKLQKGDFIEVVSAEGDWLAKLYVRSVSASGIIVHLFPIERIGMAAKKVDAAYKVVLGAKKTWRVIRNSDNVEMVALLDTREQAESWLETHLKR